MRLSICNIARFAAYYATHTKSIVEPTASSMQRVVVSSSLYVAPFHRDDDDHLLQLCNNIVYIHKNLELSAENDGYIISWE